MTIRTLPAGEIEVLRRQLHRFALSKLRDAELAEDVVQETLMSAVANSAAFAGRSKLRTWLTSILINKIADHHRASARRREVVVSESGRPESLDEDDESPDGYAARYPDWLAEPSRIVGARQELQAATRELARLSPRKARAIVMTDVEGHGTAHVCEALGVTESNLWVLLHRARRALREGMGARYA